MANALGDYRRLGGAGSVGGISEKAMRVDQAHLANSVYSAYS